MITSNTNKQIKWVRSLQSKRSVRQNEGMFVIEGTRLVEEALRSEQQAHLVLHTTSWGSRNLRLLEQLSQSKAHIELVTDSVLANCSNVETPQGVLAVLPSKRVSVNLQSDLSLILDRISDPGNLGTILRTALAAEVGSVYLTSGSVDAYNPKVVRAGMGAHFYLDIHEKSLDEIIAGIEGQELWIAEARQGEVYHQVDWRKPIVLAIGSEAHGLDPGFQAQASGQVYIPIGTHSESLNAATATAVILFEIQRQRGS
jgi:TrmH family RNA methyltransferase